MAAPFHDLRGGDSPFESYEQAQAYAQRAASPLGGRWRPRVALRRVRRQFGSPLRRWVVTLHEQRSL